MLYSTSLQLSRAKPRWKFEYMLIDLVQLCKIIFTPLFFENLIISGIGFKFESGWKKFIFLHDNNLFNSEHDVVFSPAAIFNLEFITI